MNENSESKMDTIAVIHEDDELVGWIESRLDRKQATMRIYGLLESFVESMEVVESIVN